MPELSDYVRDEPLDRLLRAALEEDLGPDRRDLTSEATIPDGVTAVAAFNARRPGVACGLALLPRLAAAWGADLRLTLRAKDGDAVRPGQSLAEWAGDLRAILALERTALNFLGHLCGIATLTARYVALVADTRARIYDTRKTIPGLRGLAKYAVACGGGLNHRIGLYDAILVKDNHLAHTPLDALAPRLTDARRQAAFVEVECDTLEQVHRVLAMNVDMILLDNMQPDLLREAVALRNRLAPHVELEASGGVNLDTVRAIAETGVDRIAIGALTHSAPALDIGLEVTPAASGTPGTPDGA